MEAWEVLQAMLPILRQEQAELQLVVTVEIQPAELVELRAQVAQAETLAVPSMFQ
jgi:hypothetical protein